MIISVDHGNKSIKTPNTLFTSGLISSEGLQGFKTDYICWNGRYYINAVVIRKSHGIIVMVCHNTHTQWPLIAFCCRLGKVGQIAVIGS